MTEASGRILSFLRGVRRRYRLRSILLSSLAAVLIGEVWFWALVLANRYLGTSFPIYFLALALVPVLLVPLLRRGTLSRIAGLADRSLGLKDRLTSFLDFAGRPSLDPAMRAAQAEETAGAIASLNPRRGIRIHPLLWLGPVLFLGRMGSHYLTTDPGDAGLFVVPGPRVGLSPPAPSPSPPEGEKRGGEQPSLRPLAPREPKAPDEQVKPGEQPAASRRAVDEKPPGTGSPTAERPGQDSILRSRRTVSRGGPTEEPTRLFSETVGRELTPVIEARYPARGATAPPEQALRGRRAFNLLPPSARKKVGGGGEGRGDGEAEAIRVVIDFDAIPVAYREYVRRYFLQFERGGSSSEPKG